MPQRKNGPVSYMSESDEDDFVPKTKKKSKLSLTRKKNETETRVHVPTAMVSSQLDDSLLGRGGRLTARLSVEELKFQQDLEQAIQVSVKDSKVDLPSKVEEDSEDDFEVVLDKDDAVKLIDGNNAPQGKAVGNTLNSEEVLKEDVVNIFYGNDETKDVSANIELIQNEEVSRLSKKENVVMTSIINNQESAENVAKKIVIPTDPEESQIGKRKLKRRSEGIWVVGETEKMNTRARNRSENFDKRMIKKPVRYVDSSESESEFESEVIVSDVESEDVFEQTPTNKSKTSKKPPVKNSHAKSLNSIEPAAAKRKPVTLSSDATPAAASDMLPINCLPQSPAFECMVGQPSSSVSVSVPPSLHNVAPSETPSPVSSITSFLAMQHTSRPKVSPSHPSKPLLSIPTKSKMPSWKPPSKVGQDSHSSPVPTGISPSLRRVGLSRNFRSPKPLHTNLKLN